MAKKMFIWKNYSGENFTFLQVSARWFLKDCEIISLQLSFRSRYKRLSSSAHRSTFYRR